MFNIMVYVYVYMMGIVFMWHVNIVNGDNLSHSGTTMLKIYHSINWKMLAGSKSNFCSDWGKPVISEDYELIKDRCYLVVRYGVLCCIYEPDCPPGLVPEIPLEAYRVYKIKKLEIGCVAKQNQNQNHMTYEEHVEFAESVKKKTSIVLYATIGSLAGTIVCMMLTCYKILKVFSGNPLFGDR